MAPATQILNPGGYPVNSFALPTALVALALAALVIVMRERRLARLRRRVAAIQNLSEQILSSRTPAEIIEKIDGDLSTTLGASRTVIYVHSREDNVLNPVVKHGGRPAPALALGTKREASPAPAMRAFESSGRVTATETTFPPHNVFCYPMFAQGSLTGVLQTEFERTVRGIQGDEAFALQHLANQAAIALKLMDQQFLREQILRGEKLGAAGELISGVAQELRAPLEMLGARVQTMLGQVRDPAMLPELRALANETAKASETLERLMSFSRGEQTRARPVALNRLLADLLEFRAQQWRMKDISGVQALGGEDLVVVGAQGQLEQAFLSLLLHAEQSVERAAERKIGVTIRARQGRVLVEIDYSAAAAAVEADSGGALEVWSLGVCRGIFENHGGTLLHQSAPARSLFVVEIPLAQAAALSVPRGPATQTRSLTLIVAEPETVTQRQLLNLLGGRNHRAIAAATATEALDYMQRVRFDVLFAATRLPDMKWAELMERSRKHVGAFVVLAEGLDQATGDARMLRKPVDEDDLDRVLADLTGASRPM